MRHKAKFNVVVGWYYFVGGIAAMAGSYILASQAGGGRVIFPSLIIAVGGFLIWRGLNLKRKAESTEKYNDPLI